MRLQSSSLPQIMSTCASPLYPAGPGGTLPLFLPTMQMLPLISRPSSNVICYLTRWSPYHCPPVSPHNSVRPCPGIWYLFPLCNDHKVISELWEPSKCLAYSRDSVSKHLFSGECWLKWRGDSGLPWACCLWQTRGDFMRCSFVLSSGLLLLSALFLPLPRRPTTACVAFWALWPELQEMSWFCILLDCK